MNTNLIARAWGTVSRRGGGIPRMTILPVIVALGALNARGWDNDVVHPQITQAAIEWVANNRGIQEVQQWGLFEISSSPQCSFIQEGSVKEDLVHSRFGLVEWLPPEGFSWEPNVWGYNACGVPSLSWVRHAYYPPTGSGWWQISSWNAVDYAGGIWTEAIADYKAGRKPDAFFKLGRLCHLLEDMSSPAHTQADVHGRGDDSEDWGAAHYSARTYAPSQMRRPSTHEYGNLSSDTVTNFLKILAWRTYDASAWQGRLVTQLGNVQPDSELKRMFPALEYENDWLTPDYWVIPEVGYFYNGTGNSEWWRCEGANGDGTGYYYLENINQKGGGPTYPNPGAWIVPQKKRADFFRRTLSSDNLDSVLMANSQPLVELYAGNLFPVAAEWVAGLMKFFLEEADNVPPQVAGTGASTTPATDIYVLFNEDMDESTLNGSSISVVGSATGRHSCAFTFDHDAFLLRISPSSDFAYGETVTVTLTTGAEDQGAEGIDGDRNGTVGPNYSFTFQIRQAPPGSPTSISVSVNAVSGTVEPYRTISISGTASYNTGQSVNGTAMIDTGDGQYTTPVANGNYSRAVTGPSGSRNVTVSVTDGLLTGNGSVYVTVNGDGSTPSYNFTTSTVYDYEDIGDGYVEYSDKVAFRTTDEYAGLLVVFSDCNLSSDLNLKARFYYPDGTPYGNDGIGSFSKDWGWGWWVHYKFIAGNAMAYTPGKYKARFYVNNDRKATKYFVIAWDFTEHKMCKSIQGEEPGGSFLPQSVTTVFSPEDTRAIAWHEFEYRAQRLDVKTEFYGPSGAGYATNEHAFADDLGAHEWYEWSRHASWIHLSGHAAQRMCGNWTVKFYIKNPSSSAWDIQYTNYFRIEESTPPTITAVATSGMPVEGQSLVVGIEGSDNNDLQRVILHWNDGSAHEQTWDDINASSFASVHTIGTSLAAGQQIDYWCEAFDESGNRSESTRAAILVQPEMVSAPARPTGNNAASTGQAVAFLTGGSTTQSGAAVDYQFDWGDGAAGSWGAPAQSHAWLTAGTYQVKARARSQALPTRMSDWSAEVAVTIIDPTRVILTSGDLAFGNVVVNTSAVRTLAITNTGDSTLTISSISYPVGFRGYDGSLSIPPGAGLEVPVTFEPTNVAEYSGVVKVISDATSGVDSVIASGKGVVAPTRVIGLSETLRFAAVVTNTASVRTLIITNTGNSALSVSSIEYPPGFRGEWSGIIAPGGEQQVTVTFDPTEPKEYSGFVRVNSDATDGMSLVWAFGIGVVAPTRVIGLSDSLAFGNVVTNTIPVRILTIMNTGNSPLTISSISYPIGFGGDWSGSIGQGQSQNVMVTFHPTEPKEYSGFVRVNSDATSGTDTVSASGTGVSRVISLSGDLAFGNLLTDISAERVMTIKNQGNSALTVSKITYPPGFSGDWSGGIIDTEASREVTVTFAPDNLGYYQGLVTVESDATAGDSSIPISGTGVSDRPRILVWGYPLAGEDAVHYDAEGVVSIAVGTEHCLALMEDGTIRAWGYNRYGQTNVPPEATNVIAIAAGGHRIGSSFSVALKADGSLSSWGVNESGQTDVPQGTAGILAIAAGGYHGIAAKQDGRVVVWGWYDVPENATNVCAVSAGALHNLALRTDGSVISWGLVDTVPTNLSSVVAIAAGGYHNLALRADGTVAAWGNNGWGQCDVPSNATNVVAIAAGEFNSLALKGDGSLVSWGSRLTGFPFWASDVLAIASSGSVGMALLGPAELKPRIWRPQRNGSHFSCIVPTMARRTYTLQVRRDSESAWRYADQLNGNGASIMLKDGNPPEAKALYRVLVRPR